MRTKIEKLVDKIEECNTTKVLVILLGVIAVVGFIMGGYFHITRGFNF